MTKYNEQGSEWEIGSDGNFHRTIEVAGFAIHLSMKPDGTPF